MMPMALPRADVPSVMEAVCVCTVAVLVAMMPMALPRADVPSVMETAFGEYSGGVGGNDAHGVA